MFYEKSDAIFVSNMLVHNLYATKNKFVCVHYFKELVAEVKFRLKFFCRSIFYNIHASIVLLKE